jgi:hypothetical protein
MPRRVYASARKGVLRNILSMSYRTHISIDMPDAPVHPSIVNARFLSAIVVQEKAAFFATVPFSHNTPRLNFIEVRQSMRYIVLVIRSSPLAGLCYDTCHFQIII